MKRILLAIFLCLNVSTILADNTLDVYNSVCTIHTELKENYIGGTGFVYHEDEDSYFVMTAGHVINGCVRDYCIITFYNSGEIQPIVEAKILKKDYEKVEELKDDTYVRDLAILKVEKNKLNFKPKVIPLASPDRKIEINEKIFSLGCPDLRWPSGFLGRIKRTLKERYYFDPNIISGRSGSPVYNEDCTLVIGVVIWRTGSGGCAINPYGLSLHKIK